MKKPFLLLVPAGGLANRMRAVVSAYSLAKITGSHVQVVWFKDWALYSPFKDIFMPINEDIISLREANIFDHLVNDRPRKKNFNFFKIPQHLIYERCIYERFVSPLKEKGFDFYDWAAGHRCYMSCYQEFGEINDLYFRQLFHPTAIVEEIINGHVAKFSSHTIGLHIRRTDNVESIEKSPTDIFCDAVAKEISEYHETKIFLATDSEEVKDEIRNRYRERVITSSSEADRGSTEGIREGLADMYTLSRTAKIYGSAGSSFSVMASRIGGNELIIVEK